MSRQYLNVMAVASLLFVICPHPAEAATGTVVHKISGCDYFVVSTARGYDLLEWYGGYDPDKGDVLVGRYEEYGMHDVYDDTTDEEVSVWVEDYGLSKENALEQIADRCE